MPRDDINKELAALRAQLEAITLERDAYRNSAKSWMRAALAAQGARPLIKDLASVAGSDNAS